MKKIINKKSILITIFVVVLAVVLYFRYAPEYNGKELCHAKNCTNYAVDGEIYCEDHMATKIVRAKKPARKSYKTASIPSTDKPEDETSKDISQEDADSDKDLLEADQNGDQNESVTQSETAASKIPISLPDDDPYDEYYNAEGSEEYDEGFCDVTEKLTYDVIRYENDLKYRAGVDDGIDLLVENPEAYGFDDLYEELGIDESDYEDIDPLDFLD